MSAFVNFLAALPALFKLFQTLEARIEAAGAERKAREDIETIHEAFKKENPDQLNALFRSL